MAEKEAYLESLNLLRFPLAIVIVIIHVCNPESFLVLNNTFPIYEQPFISAFQSFLAAFLRGQSVPIYFFISGFVFFLGFELTRKKFLQKLSNRVKSLFIPYVFWCLAALLVLWLKSLCFPDLAPELKRFIPDYTLESFLSIFWMCPGSMMPINYPLWFLRDLMLIALATPLIYFLIKKLQCCFVLILGMCWFILSHFDVGYWSSIIMSLFFFTWGAYFSISRKNILVEFKRYFVLSMLLYPGLGLLYILSENYFPFASGTIKLVNILVGLLFAYNIAAWLVSRKKYKISPFLVSTSFFIYVSHSLVGGGFAKLCFKLINPQAGVGMFFVYVCGVLGTLGLLLLTYYILRKYTPSFLRTITGRK